MSQLVTFPTRAHNTLDLLFTNHPDSVLPCHPVPGLSDHDGWGLFYGMEWNRMMD